MTSEEMITIGAVFAFITVLSVMILKIFSRMMNWLSGKGPLPVAAVLRERAIVTVHLMGSRTFERVHFLGFTDPTADKSDFPFDFAKMAILEDGEKTKFLVRVRDIKMIEIPNIEQT